MIKSCVGFAVFFYIMIKQVLHMCGEPFNFYFIASIRHFVSFWIIGRHLLMCKVDTQSAVVCDGFTWMRMGILLDYYSSFFCIPERFARRLKVLRSFCRRIYLEFSNFYFWHNFPSSVSHPKWLKAPWHIKVLNVNIPLFIFPLQIIWRPFAR